MNKKELIDQVSSCAGISKAATQRAIDCYHQCITGALSQGERVGLVGFGSFSVTQRSARKGRNPQTGKEMTIGAKKVIKFRPGIHLSEKVQK